MLILKLFNIHLGLDLAAQLSIIPKSIMKRGLLDNLAKGIMINIIVARQAIIQERAQREDQLLMDMD